MQKRGVAVDIKVVIQKYKSLLIVAALIVGLILYGSGREGETQQSTLFIEPKIEGEGESHTLSTDVQESRSPAQETVLIDIKGAVKKPGIYQLQSGERIHDAVHKAGGFLEGADQTQVNLAQRVQDEMIIYIPKVGEDPSATLSLGTDPLSVGSSGSSAGGQSGVININTATSEQLQELPGIGEAKALAIIEYREMNGPFQKPEDLQNVTGIGGKTFEKLKDKIGI